MRKFYRNLRENFEKKYLRNTQLSVLKNENVKKEVNWLIQRTNVNEVAKDSKLSEYKWPVFTNAKYDFAM